MVMGHDVELTGGGGLRAKPRLFYVDNDGVVSEGEIFSVGSGSTYAYGILDSDYRPDLTEAEALALAEKAIRRAASRDAYSGGFVNVFVLPTPTKGGSGRWRHVVRGDTGQVKAAGEA
mmetsp:Transcript_8431/g.24336  ORF Transcript_8431/g.24336 Transcript_8431/m.24336 type:complete len:118 (-) Transcript_8431:95-448(-)